MGRRPASLRRAGSWREFIGTADRVGYAGAVAGDTLIGSLYVHVPFCARKCEYCAFYSEVAAEGRVDDYLDALIREMALVAGDVRLRTIFIGGGTPTVLSLRQWERLLAAMQGLGPGGAGEWTVECNPATLSAEKAGLLRTAGVNRISMGVQSLDAGLLERLGRVHSREAVFRAWDALRGAGFDNLNLDLMFAIPGQTSEMWERTLREAVALQSEHLSCYEVMYEEDTPLFRQMQATRTEVDEDRVCGMYERLCEVAAGAGLVQYEVANWARDVAMPETGSEVPARACRHNVNYWRGGSFYGLGPSATSYVRGVRTKAWPAIGRYCADLARGERSIESSECLAPLARAGETAAFGLRMRAGWPFAEFQRVTGFDLRTEWRGEMQEMVARGWGSWTEDRFRLTERGLRFADQAAEMCLRPQGA